MNISKTAAVPLFILAILALLTGTIRAQNRVFFTTFPGISLTMPVSTSFDLMAASSLQYNTAEKEYSDNDFPAAVNYYDLQAGAVYRHTQILQFAAAWYYRHTDPGRNGSAVENRFWQQVSASGMVSNLRIRNRFRLEQRLISRNGKSDPLRWRFRYLAGIEIPLQGEKTDIGEFYLTASNELYLSLNTPRPAIYSENWVTAFAGYRISQKNRIEAGPAWQLQVRNQKKELNHSIHFQISLLLNLNFVKTKPNE